MQYDLYDFDKTVYPTDSESVFWLFCLLRRPYIALCIPYQFFCLLCFQLNIGGDAMKGRFFCFLRFLDGPKLARAFWKNQYRRIYPFFFPENRSRPCVVCSASPEFFLEPVCTRLGVTHLVATRMNPKSGRIEGLNCKGGEKVLRLHAQLPDAQFLDVYSDSLAHDAPIFALGKRNFLAEHGTLTEIPLQKGTDA